MANKLTLEYSFSGIERAYSKLKNAEVLHLFLPSFDDLPIGVQPFVIQFTNTWIRKTSPRSNIVVDSIITTADIQKFASNPIGFCISLMTIKQGRKILGKNNSDVTAAVAKEALKALDESRPIINEKNQKVFRRKGGQYVHAFCFDHAAMNLNKYNGWFYQQNLLLDEGKGFTNFYTAVIDKLVTPTNARLSKSALKPEITSGVTAVIKELIENTHEHAIKDYGTNSNIPLDPNLRGILVNVHRGDYKYFKSKVSLGDPFDMYFANPATFPNKTEQKTFLEISVIDSGPGFVQRYSTRPLSSMTQFVEKEFLSDCLRAYKRGAKNQGLKRIGACVSDKRGFFKIRTGRLSLYRNYLIEGFREHQHDHPGEKSLIFDKLFDWYKNDTGTTHLEQCSGSLITIIYPIETI